MTEQNENDAEEVELWANGAREALLALIPTQDLKPYQQGLLLDSLGLIEAKIEKRIVSSERINSNLIEILRTIDQNHQSSEYITELNRKLCDVILTCAKYGLSVEEPTVVEASTKNWQSRR